MMPENTIYAEDAGDKETPFFAREPWSSLSHASKQRLGVPALNDYLRRRKIAEAWPDNLKSIRAHWQQVETEVNDLSDPLDVH
jgi:hypothetical protein